MSRGGRESFTEIGTICPAEIAIRLADVDPLVLFFQHFEFSAKGQLAEERHAEGGAFVQAC
jgi:hypothetical protein